MKKYAKFDNLKPYKWCKHCLRMVNYAEKSQCKEWDYFCGVCGHMLPAPKRKAKW